MRCGLSIRNAERPSTISRATSSRALNSFLYGSLAGHVFCAGLLLWGSAFLGSHLFRDLFLRTGIRLLCFFRRRNLIQDHTGCSPCGGFASERFGSFNGPCFYRPCNPVQGRAGRSRRGGSSCSRSIGNFTSKRFGFFSNAFPCGYNRFLHTRYDAFIRHVHSSVAGHPGRPRRERYSNFCFLTFRLLIYAHMQTQCAGTFIGDGPQQGDKLRPPHAMRFKAVA